MKLECPSIDSGTFLSTTDSFKFYRRHSLNTTAYKDTPFLLSDLKDLGIALQAASTVELDMPITALVEQMESNLIERGCGDDDVSALHRWNTGSKEA